MTELKNRFEPCPLCGGKVMFYDKKASDYEVFGTHFVCMDCDVMFCCHEADFNRRPHIDALTAALQSARDELMEMCEAVNGACEWCMPKPGQCLVCSIKGKKIKARAILARTEENEG